MKTWIMAVFIASCCAIGFTFFLIQRKCLIIQFTCRPSTVLIAEQTQQSKPIKIFYSKHNAWQKEEASIIWDEAKPSRNLTQLITQWLATLQEEKLLNQYISLESVAVSSPGTEVYISFDRTLFAREWSILQKWLILEGLFKTMHHANIQMHNVTLLVHKQSMLDDHIDFSHPIPIQKWLPENE